MTQSSTQSRALSRYARLRFGCLGLCVVAAALNGCAAEKKTKVRSFPWSTAKSVRPVLPAGLALSMFTGTLKDVTLYSSDPNLPI